MKTWIADLIDEELLQKQFLNETNEEFIQRICSLCLDEIEDRKGFAPMGFGESVLDEIQQEVADVLKIKTYGYYNISAYRRSFLKKRLC